MNNFKEGIKGMKLQTLQETQQDFDSQSKGEVMKDPSWQPELLKSGNLKFIQIKSMIKMMSQTHQVKDKCQIFRYMLNIKTLFLSGSGYFTKYDLKCNDRKEIVL